MYRYMFMVHRYLNLYFMAILRHEYVLNYEKNREYKINGSKLLLLYFE